MESSWQELSTKGLHFAARSISAKSVNQNAQSDDAISCHSSGSDTCRNGKGVNPGCRSDKRIARYVKVIAVIKPVGGGFIVEGNYGR